MSNHNEDLDNESYFDHEFVSSIQVIYEDAKLRVRKNSSNEIFVQDIKTGAEMRISDYPYGGLLFTTAQRVDPVRVTNMIGWNIHSR